MNTLRGLGPSEWAMIGSGAAALALATLYGEGTARLLAMGIVLLLAAATAALTFLLRRRVVQDLQQLVHELDEKALPDLTSLHPRTATGRDLADRLQVLLTRAQQALREGERVRAEIERAQSLRVGFVASMGHDLRGPLSSMLGFAELLLHDESPEAETQRKSVQTIFQRTMDLLTLIDEMLDWARMEAGRISLVPAPLSCPQVLSEVRALAEKRSAGRGLQVHTEALGTLPEVQGDLRHLARAIVAVLGDAIVAGSQEPVVIRAEPAAEGGVAIRVHDPTLLIREEDRTRFFEAFRPSYAPSGKRISGLGLGAACAKALIDAHGGELSFESTRAEGTIFRIWLPPAAQQ